MSASADPLTTIATTEVRGTPAERAGALHDLSIAHVELGHLDVAARLARRGLRLTGEARFHLTLAWIDLDRGRREQSLRHLDLATPHLRRRELARARCLRGLHLCQSAEPRLAVAELTAVIGQLRRYGDERWLANALIGRGIARCAAARLAAADRDFTAAQAVLRSIGEPGRAAMCLHNRGFVAMLAGDLPLALRRYEEAAAAGLDSASRPEALVDRAEALLAAGLTAEARRVLAPALELLRRCNRHVPELAVLSARCALRAGDPAPALRIADRDVEFMLAAGQLDAVAAHRFRGPVRTRALGWLAQARRSDRRGALAACRAGIRLLDEHHGDWPRRELTGHALGLARTAREVLHWSEQHRVRTPLPPNEPRLAAALAKLRRARAFGMPLEALERDVRRLTLAAGRRGGRVAATPPDLPLVSFIAHGGRMRAVTVVDGRARVRVVEDPAELVRTARLALRAGRDVALDLLPEADEVVVVPDGVLHGMPWAALGQRVHVVPSLRHWRPTARGGHRVWVAGPRLPNEEVTALREEHGGVLVEPTVEATLAGLEGAGIAHIAAHGHVHPENPLFSHLELRDGPLYGYDIARIENPPEVVVLSACESGLARAFLDAGSTAVLASVLPVPDAQVGAAMTEVHRLVHHPVRAAGAVAHLGFSCYGTGTTVAACRAAANDVPVQSSCAEPTVAGTSTPDTTTSTQGPCPEKAAAAPTAVTPGRAAGHHGRDEPPLPAAATTLRPHDARTGGHLSSNE
ncbi:CHAT domain-containing protein [Lentzea xinjiangensis]|uniref:CHAT domain-containing protein n=1 Tax=Lentzea xinjiangensis TaxID=402600 RepID=A0A1H9AYF2_9PSEU|nr:CHAT domain-containing protein [Lentzea xinjiangensis]SEP81501.1 CHAT domain-containing protein [Lentzea xinjiangensis]